MKHDKLTIQAIKTDLHNRIMSEYLSLLSCIFCFIFFLVLLFLCIHITVRPYDDVFLFIFCGVLLCFAVAAALYYGVKQTILIVEIYKLFCKTDITNCIVRDKLISAEQVNHRHTYTCYLRFVGYGEYVIPRANYKWSPVCVMSDRSVLLNSKHGDEFYLVLSKPHIGKIILAYNTQIFELKK